jgi:hypothetical protein
MTTLICLRVAVFEESTTVLCTHTLEIRQRRQVSNGVARYFHERVPQTYITYTHLIRYLYCLEVLLFTHIRTIGFYLSYTIEVLFTEIYVSNPKIP